MPSDLSSYLATHYLTADAKPAKKRKRKHQPDSGGGGLLITDDDDSGWAKPAGNDSDVDEAEGGPATVAGTSAEFRRAKKSSWKTVGAPIPVRSQTKDGRDEEAAADAVLASAAAEAAAARADDEDEPAVVDEPSRPSAMMSDGTHAGLQSAAAISAQLARRQAEERAELEELEREKRRRKKERAKNKAGDDESEEEQLVLRDATGRRVDVAMRRAEARRAAADAEALAARDEQERKKALMGQVQLEEARKRRERLDDAALMTVARRKDDQDMNDEMRAEQRWNDPMAQFLGDDDAAPGQSKSTDASKRGKASRRPVYKGAAQPNRYGIKPGYRWDGVDRGNGFEAERFKALNRRERNKGLEYSWQMDE
jgi:pre-mRNA-splicing factor CWC26